MTTAGNSSASPPQITVPQLDTPLVLPSLAITPPWYRFLIDMWKKLGGSLSSSASAIFLIQDTTGVDAYNTQGTKVGVVAIFGNSAQDEQVQGPGVSPFVFTATQPGSVVVSEGQVEFQRGNLGTWRTVGLAGGSIFMLENDSIRVTWYGVNAPGVFFYPSFAAAP